MGGIGPVDTVVAVRTFTNSGLGRDLGRAGVSDNADAGMEKPWMEEVGRPELPGAEDLRSEAQDFFTGGAGGGGG